MHARRTLLLATLFASAIAVPALAQTTPPVTNYAACTSKPTQQDSDAAHNAFLLGKRFFDEADYGSAVHNFVDAYKLDCTKTDLLVTIARANELAGNKAEAVHALETYLQRAQTLAPEDKTQIQKRIDNLKALIAAQTPAPTVAPLPVPTVIPLVEPTPTTRPLPPPPPAEEAHHTAGPWVVTAIGGASLVTGGVVWLVGHGNYEDAISKCKSQTNCSADVTSEGNGGRTMMQVGGGLFIGGGVLAAVGLIWHFVEPSGPSGDKKASVEPVLAPGYAGIAGRF